MVISILMDQSNFDNVRIDGNKIIRTSGNLTLILDSNSVHEVEDQFYITDHNGSKEYSLEGGHWVQVH